MSEFETTTPGGTGAKEKARQVMDQAGQTLKAEAQSFASVAQDRVMSEAQKGQQAATRTLGDFANAIRRAGEELAQTDQSPASRMARKAADGLEEFSRGLEGKDPGDLLNDVRDFGRRNPMAFIGGAVLIGLALGRFVRASEPSGMHPLAENDMSFEPNPTMGLAGMPVETTSAPDDMSLGAIPVDESISAMGVDDTVSDMGSADAALDDGAADTTSPHAGGR